MRGSWLLVAFSLLALSFSGCLADSSTDGGDGADNSGSGGDSMEGGNGDGGAMEGGESGSSSSDSSDMQTGNVRVEEKEDGDGNTYYEASRVETFENDLTGTTGTADISTGAGFISYTGGGGTDYKLVATLKARANSEENATAKLAEMSVDHTVANAAAVVIDVHGNPGGNGQWKDKTIDLKFDAPEAIDWSSFEAASSAGYIKLDSVTGTLVDLVTAAGYIDMETIDADTLDVFTSAGYVEIRRSVVGDMDLGTAAGAINANMLASTKSGSWDLSNSAGAIDLQVKEQDQLGYSIDASSSAGSVEFDLSDFEEDESDCQFASCSKSGQTTNYSNRTIKIEVDLDTSAGAIYVSS